MSTDFTGVSASWDRTPPNYDAGQSATATISGQAVTTMPDVTTHETVGPATIPVQSASGAQSTVSVPAFVAATTTPGQTVNEDVTIDRTRPITGLGTRVVTYAADNKSFTVQA